MTQPGKILMVLFIFSVVLIVVFSTVVQNKIATDARMETGQSLSAVLGTTHQAVKSWLSGHKATVKVWANEPLVRQSSKALSGTSGNTNALIDSAAQAKLRSWFRPLQQATGYQGFFIIGLNNINLASSRDQNVGMENLLVTQQKFMHKVWSGETAVSLPEKSDVPLPDQDGNVREGLASIFVGAPITDESGSVIALFTIRINPADDFTRILQQGRIGNTGETYAFDRRGLLISNSRFNDQLYNIDLLTNEAGILNLYIRDPGVNLLQGGKSDLPVEQRPLTFMAEKAVSGISGMNLEGYRDYRGVPVVGAWLWDEELGFGIATELDTSEAFQTLHATNYTIIAFTLLLLLFSTSITVVTLNNYARKRAQSALIESEARFKSQYQSMPTPTYTWQKDADDFILIDYNQAALDITGGTVKEIIGKTLHELYAGKPNAEVEEDVKRCFSTQAIIRKEMQYQFRTTKDIKYLDVVYVPLPPDLVVIHTYDLTERKQAEEAVQRSEVLERLSTGASLDEILTAIVNNAEKHNPETLCTVLLLDKDGKHLSCGAAPSLPDFYNDAIDGIEIGPNMGSCGLAAYTGERVIVEDIMDHPNWENYREVAKKAKLRACWSEPVVSIRGDVLGTFAIYYREPRRPRQRDIDFIRDSARLAGIAIERKQAEDQLRASESELKGILDSMQDVYYRTDVEGKVVWASPSALQVTGYCPEELIGKPVHMFWRYPDKRQDMLAAMLENGGLVHNFEVEGVHKSGRIVWGSVNAHFCYSESGEPAGVEGTIRDVTKRKQTEAKTLELLDQNRQLTQRMFEVQEEERRHLAHELHDEFGQWLTAIHLNAETISQINKGQSIDIQACVQTIDVSATEMHKNIRGMMRQLRPALLDELGLVESLKDLADHWQTQHPAVDIKLLLDGELDSFDDNLNITMYRIIQESLTNVAKHAGASEVAVQLIRPPTGTGPQCDLQLTVVDNGKGLDNPVTTDGIGLPGMRERVLAAGGRFEIKSTPEKGVRIEVRIPVNC